MDFIEYIKLISSDYTLRTITLGTAVLGAVTGMLGSFAVLRKQSLLGDAISHAALPGIAIAFLINFLKKNTTYVFVIYRVGIGVAILLFLYFNIINP